MVSKLATMKFSPFFLKGEGLASASESQQVATPEALSPLLRLSPFQAHRVCTADVCTGLPESQACSSIPLVPNWVGKPDLVLLVHSIIAYSIFTMSTGAGLRHGSPLGGLLTCHSGQANDLMSLQTAIL